MPTINQLSSVDQVVSSDQVPIYSSGNGDARKASMAVLLKFMQDNLNFPSQDGSFPQYSTQYASPSANGFSVSIVSVGTNIWLILAPTAGFATGTLVLPAVGTCVDGQEILVNCTQQITALTIDGNGATAVTGAPSPVGADDFFRLRFDLPTHSWYRVG